MALLGREDILNSEDYETEYVLVNEWRPSGSDEDMYVRVRSLTARQRSQVESVMYEIDSAQKGFDRIGEISIKSVIWGVIDEDGKQVFKEGDLNKLGGKNADPVLRIRRVVFRLSGLNRDAVPEAVEDLGDAQSSDSPTG